LTHNANISSITISPDSRMILTTCFDYNAFLWNFNSNLLARFKGHNAKINAGIFTQDGSHILTVADDGYVLRWNTPDEIFTKLRKYEIAPLSPQEEQLYGVKHWGTQEFIHQIKTAAISLLSSKEEQ
jgi:WD40 repeat protein